MRALVMWSRADARRRIGTLVGLALLITLAGGATLASLAGARRAATAYERLRVRTMAMDAAVFGDPATVRASTSDPHVAASSPFAIAGVFALDNPDLFPFVEPGSRRDRADHRTAVDPRRTPRAIRTTRSRSFCPREWPGGCTRRWVTG